MKKFTLKLVVSLLVISLVLGACTTTTPTQVSTQPPAAQPTQPPAAEPTQPPAAEPTQPPTAEPTEPPTPEPTADPLAPLSPPESIRVAFVPIMKFATLYVAKERGFFDDLGLDVEMIPVTSGTEAIAFLSEGTIEVGGIAIVVSLWNGWNQGMDLKIIAPGGLEPFTGSPTKFLVAKELYDNGTVTQISDLAGQTVATAGGPGSGGEYLAAKALERGGLTIFDVNLMNIGNADMPMAFENGSIAAGLLGSPYAEQVEDAGFAVSIAEDLTPGLMTVAFVSSGKFIEERPDAAKRFVLALVQAARAMQGDDYLSDENIAAYMAHVSTTPEALRTGAPVIYDPDQAIPVEGLADVERVHRENGRLEYTEPIDVSTVVDESFVEWALSVLN
jgi:NitT/TauT family transport system substrate-binding protein